jgi:hypothetical protein
MAADQDLRLAYGGDGAALARFDQRGGVVHLQALPAAERERHLASLPGPGTPGGRPRRIEHEGQLRPGEVALLKLSGPGAGLFADRV